MKDCGVNMNKKICRNCKWYYRKEYYDKVERWCRRFPEWVLTLEDHFCGEFEIETKCKHDWWLWRSPDDVPEGFGEYNRVDYGKAYSCMKCGVIKIKGKITQEYIIDGKVVSKKDIFPT